MMRLECISALVLVMVSVAAQGAEITVVSTDAAGVGFNDSTPFTAVGGNNAETLGEARFNVFRAAAEQWGALIESEVEIVVEASFADQECDANSGTLGSAGAFTFLRDFPGAVQAQTFYPVALANALAGEDLDDGDPDIVAEFNGALDTGESCLTGITFYYGSDHAGGSEGYQGGQP